MEYTGILKERTLIDLQQGQTMVIVLTNATACILQFLNAGDATWHTHPGFTGTPNGAGVIIQELRCISGRMRLNFTVQPVTPYNLSLTWAAAPTF